MSKATCSVEGCTATIQARGWCSRHYHRWRRTGTPDDRAHRPLTTSHGYVRVYRPDHPLSTPTRGWVYEHRVVLYDTIGPGAHPCFWCGDTVSWSRTYPTHHDALCVDHLDGDRANNHPANLKPSCHGCNSGRAATRRHALQRAISGAWRFAP